MEYHSYASESRGLTDPEDAFAFQVNGEHCPIERHGDDCEHFTLMWSGNEYSKDHTWITCESTWLCSLEDCR